MDNEKTCLITGASGGIGKQAAIAMARQGYIVLAVVRNNEKSHKAIEEIKSRSNQKVYAYFADLSSQKEIIAVSKKILGEHKKLDVLINNAGVYKMKHTTTPDGLESTFAVNYLSHFLLTYHLLPLLKKSASARIVNVSSKLYKNAKISIDEDSDPKNYNSYLAYANSKAYINYFTVNMAERLKPFNITVNCIHPGVIATDAFRELPKIVEKLLSIVLAGPEQGAKPIVYLATSPEVAGVSGVFFSKMEREKYKNIDLTPRTIDQIHKWSENLARVQYN